MLSGTTAMHFAGTSVYVCMLLDQRGAALAAEVIEAESTASAAVRAAEMMECAFVPAKAYGFELWHRGRKLTDGRAS